MLGTKNKITNKQCKFLFPMTPNTGVYSFSADIRNVEWLQKHLEEYKKNKIVYQGNDRDRNNVKLKDKEILSLKLLKVSKSQWTF